MAKNSKTFTFLELAEKLGGELAGAGELIVRGVTGLEEAGAEEITFIDDTAKLAAAEAGKAGAIIVPLEVRNSSKPIIRVKNPKLAFAQVLGLFQPETSAPMGIHLTAMIGEGVQLGNNVAIGAYCVIADGARLGDGVVVYPQVYIGREAVIGKGTVIWPQVVIGWETQIGANCILHSGAVIGADGFGYLWEGQRRHKIPQIGRVVIEDEVEIGANSTVDRATTSATRIGRGCKIDNQVHIAHNVTLGENCVIAGGTGISGSAHIGPRVMMAGQVGLGDHVTVGEDSILLARAAVLTDLPAGSVASGIPAYPHREQLRVEAAARKLPEALRELKELRARIARLEDKS
jgi:UDP-3-O-[3-hydroxymyristoyl] glucosamine N-acyltransferase